MGASKGKPENVPISITSIAPSVVRESPASPGSAFAPEKAAVENRTPVAGIAGTVHVWSFVTSVATGLPPSFDGN